MLLNIGLAELEKGDRDAATDNLWRAVLLGGNRSESHFNLVLVDERLGRFADADREMLASLRLDPEQPDARNLLGAIYAEEGKTARASLLWRELMSSLVASRGVLPARRFLAAFRKSFH